MSSCTVDLVSVMRVVLIEYRQEGVVDDKIGWTVACVGEFARRFDMPAKAAFHYLYEHGGIAFLDQHYEAEHLLSFDDAVEDLEIVCKASICSGLTSDTPIGGALR